ncbi:hypothetical protein LINPERPRIM_LOCUS14126 [Linum perenne]
MLLRFIVVRLLLLDDEQSIARSCSCRGEGTRMGMEIISIGMRMILMWQLLLQLRIILAVRKPFTFDSYRRKLLLVQ